MYTVTYPPTETRKASFDPVHPPAITDYFSALFYAIFHKLSAVSNVNPPSFLKLLYYTIVPLSAPTKTTGQDYQWPNLC